MPKQLESVIQAWGGFQELQQYEGYDSQISRFNGETKE